MNQATEKKISDFLSRLYALQPQEVVHSIILEGLGSLIGSENAIICRHSLVTKQALEVSLSQPFSNTAYLQSVNETGAALDHPLWDAIANDPTAPIQLSNLMTKHQWESHPLFCEFFRYDHVADHLTVDLPSPAKTSTMIGVLRSRRGFSRSETEILRALVPHLQQALANARLFELTCGEEFQTGNLLADSPCGLTPREQQTLCWVREGKTDAEIAIILGISIHTVKDYLKRIYRKLGVRNRTEAARCAGLLSQ